MAYNDLWSSETGHCCSPKSRFLFSHSSIPCFDLGPAPFYYLKLKYPIHSVYPTQWLSINSTSNQLEFNINDYFEFETNATRTLRPKFDSYGVEDTGPLFIDFSRRKLRAKYNDTLQVNTSKELGTTL